MKASQSSYPIGEAYPRFRMLQLTSQALPTGAFAYSGGLESAMALGFMEGSESYGRFLTSWMRSALGRVDLPYFLRIRNSFFHQDIERARYWSRRLFASRDSAEGQAQDRQMARALEKIITQLLPSSDAQEWSPLTYVEALAFAGVGFGLSEEDALVGCAYGWLEQHVSALTRLVPLGPIAGQRLLDTGILALPGVVALARDLLDEELGGGCPAMAMAGALHETQYSRMFRS